jgi:hypothetical protein
MARVMDRVAEEGW